MLSHNDFLHNMSRVRTALVGKYTWFIHSTPESNIDSIRLTGLCPSGDQVAPLEVQDMFPPDAAVPILCLHPLGADLRPRGACKNYMLPMGAPDPKLVSIAVLSNDLPSDLGLDWSYAWEVVLNWFSIYSTYSIESMTLKIAQDFGSIVSYERILPQKLRVCVNGDLSNLDSWVPLSKAKNEDIARHD